jgi:hypothetical protein
MRDFVVNIQSEIGIFASVNIERTSSLFAVRALGM